VRPAANHTRAPDGRPITAPQQLDDVSKDFRCSVAADADPNTAAKLDLDAATSIRSSWPLRFLRDDLDWQHRRTFGIRRLRQQLTPPQEKLVRVHIITPGDD
jgi:hypothetical protein